MIILIYSPNDVSDVNPTPTKAICPKCQRRVIDLRESCNWNEKFQQWEADDLCSELPDNIKPSNRFARPHEW